MERIPFCSPSIIEQDVRCVADSVPNCSGDDAGNYQHRFERSFADYVGVRHAFAVSSRSAAVHVAFAALEIKSGDEVIVPDIVPLSSLLPLRYLGAMPVFVDVDPKSWCLAAESFRKAITPRTRAVMPVDLYGTIPEMHRIRAIARARGIAVVEDGSDALGGEFLGRRVGSLGDAGVFGFDRAETITSGEGGMVVTDCDQLAAGIQKSLCDSGFDYHISPMQAALGASQLERIDDLVSRKREIDCWYRQALAGTPGISFPTDSLGTDCVPNELALAFEPALGLTAGTAVEQLSRKGVECHAMVRPASSFGMYDDLAQAQVARTRNQISYAVSQHVISLPSGTNLTRDDVESIARLLRNVVAQHCGLQSSLAKAA